MDKEEQFCGVKDTKKLAPTLRFKTPCHVVFEKELKECWNKLEHLAEILEPIFHHQRTSECYEYELAEASRRQTIHSKAYLQLIGRLLTNLT